MDSELQQGIERLTQIFEDREILKLLAKKIPGWLAFYFVATAYEEEWPFTLSREALSDLPAMKSYQEGANRFARGLESRFRNNSPHLFLCSSGVPLLIEAQWPSEPMPNRAASLVRTVVTNTQDRQSADCFVVITHKQSLFDLKNDPFWVHEGIVNSIRAAVDSGEIKFYPQGAHPIELQEVKLITEVANAGTRELINKFLRDKAIWLAFKAGDASSKVWIADPWDADYVGVTTAELKRSAQVLNARDELQLDDAHEFASVGRALLARMEDFEPRTSEQSQSKLTTHEAWDVFISHASEDKDEIVRPLADSLRARGLRVWYDEFELKVGDHLRRSIDDGLAHSRYGIVVLSPAFFAKHWPQTELDGLAAREVGGSKVILPVWHNIEFDGVRRFSPTLADRLAAQSFKGMEKLVEDLLAAMSKV